ncbi:hypothetical protein K1719_042554 [Acacia pycnantha]|nr:hypothetical protein K1719_042554 [Acacia pycnantha]
MIFLQRLNAYDKGNDICEIIVDASILLRHYNWNVSEVHEAWFANEEHVRRIVGLLEKPVVQFPNARELTCGICFETYPCSRIESVACGDLPLKYPQKDLIIYEMHVQGFTKHESSRTEFPGTYLGVVEKLDHLKIFGTEIAYSEEEIDLVRNLLARHLLQHIDE